MYKDLRLKYYRFIPYYNCIIKGRNSYYRYTNYVSINEKRKFLKDLFSLALFGF